MANEIFGVWPDGMLNTYKSYSPEFGHVILGTHMANDPMVIFTTYGFTYMYNWTYNLTYCSYDLVASYVASYGYTYAAVTYRSYACNIKSFGWI